MILKRITAVVLTLALVISGSVFAFAEEYEFDASKPDYYDQWGRAIYLDEFGQAFYIDDEGYPTYVGTPVDEHYGEYGDETIKYDEPPVKDNSSSNSGVSGDTIRVNPVVIYKEGSKYVDKYGREFIKENGTYYPKAIENFERIYDYKPGTFTDVDENAWYADSVATVYEMGLMMGDGEGHFNPNGNVTMAEVHALAARISSIYKTGTADFIQGSPWYQVYYDFIDEYNYYSSDQLTAPNTAAKRDQFARALFAAIPVRYDRYDAPYKIYDKWDWPVINEILYTDIADIDDGAWASGEDILRLYKAGILTGSDSNGSFKPNTNITRAEAAAIIERIAFPELRKEFTPATHTPINLEFYEDTVFPTAESVIGVKNPKVEKRNLEDGSVRTIYEYSNVSPAQWKAYKTFMLDYADELEGTGSMFDYEYKDFTFYLNSRSIRSVSAEYSADDKTMGVFWDFYYGN